MNTLEALKEMLKNAERALAWNHAPAVRENTEDKIAALKTAIAVIKAAQAEGHKK